MEALNFTVMPSPTRCFGGYLRWGLRKMSVCPLCVSDHCAITTHQLLIVDASTLICVMVATTLLLKRLAPRLLMRRTKQIMMTRVETDTAISTVPMSIPSSSYQRTFKHAKRVTE